MRRILLVLATMAAAVLVASGLALAAPPVTETHTFTNTDPIAINDGEPVGLADPYPSSICVGDQGEFAADSRIKDVNLSLIGFTHNFPEDVDVLLVAPSGESAIVMSDAGSSDGSVINITLDLDDEAKKKLPEFVGQGSTLATGAYKPANYGKSADFFPSPAPIPSKRSSLSVFNRTDPNGCWELYIVDDFPEDTGSVSGGWTLTITATS